MQARDSSRKRWRHANSSPAESLDASSRLRMDDEDDRVLSLLQDSVDLESSVLSELHLASQKGPSLSTMRYLEAAHHVTRDDLRATAAATPDKESGSHHPASPTSTPRSFTPLRSAIRLVPSAASGARPIFARSALGEGVERWEETEAGPEDRDSVVAVRDKVLVSEDVLRRLVIATQERDVLLHSLANPRARLFLTDRGAAAARPQDASNGCGGSSSSGTGWGDDETPVKTGLRAHVAAGTPSRGTVFLSLQGGAGKRGRAEEAVQAENEMAAVREMRVRLEEALAVAEQLRLEKKVLHKDLQALQTRWAASRKIAEKARLGEKDVSQSLSMLSGEHRDLVQRLIQQRHEHATKTAALHKEAAAATQALARITNVLVARRDRNRLRRAALRAWKTVSLDSLLNLLAKSALVLKCAAVAHTRSALRSALRTAARAWWERTQVATSASARAGNRRHARARLRCGGLLRVWRIWARGARRVRCSARVVKELVESRHCFRAVANALGCWRESTRIGAPGGLAGAHEDQAAWFKYLAARKWRAVLRGVVLTWHQVTKRARRLRLLELRAHDYFEHGQFALRSRAWAAWHWSRTRAARLRCLARQVLRRCCARIMARAVREWGNAALHDARRRQRQQRNAAKWSRARACRAWSAWKGGVVAAVWKGRVVEGVCRRWQRQLLALALLCWSHRAALRRRYQYLIRKALKKRVLVCVCASFSAWVLGLGGDAENEQAQSTCKGAEGRDASESWNTRSCDTRQLKARETSRADDSEAIIRAKDAQIARLVAQVEDLHAAQQLTTDQARPASGREEGEKRGERGGGQGAGPSWASVESGSSVEEAKTQVQGVLTLLEEEKQRREMLEHDRALDRSPSTLAPASTHTQAFVCVCQGLRWPWWMARADRAEKGSARALPDALALGAWSRALASARCLTQDGVACA
jgi:hypothetical protein